MFSFKFFVIPEKKNALRLRMTNNRKKTELSLGISLTEDELEKILKGGKGASSLHASLIRQWQSQLEVIKVNLLRANRRNIEVGALKKIVQAMLLDNSVEMPKMDGSEEEAERARMETERRNWERFYAGYIESKKNRSYKESCEYTLKKMREYGSSDEWPHEKGFPDMVFDDLSLKWLNAFDEWLMESGASQNTRNIHFKNIRTCLNRAIDEELTNNYPFRRFKIRQEETRKRNLPVEELRKLFNYPVEQYQEYYLDYFKLIFMLIGINTIDLFNLTKIEDGRIEYRRAKTKRLYSIKVEPEAMEIINRHRAQNGDRLLDITDRWKDHRGFQKYCNEALKKIGRMRRVGRGGKKEIKPEWPELSTYWARHSWATIARAKPLKIPKDDVALALGHGKKTVTDVYIDEDRDVIDEANRRVLDWVLYGKK